MLGLLRCGHGGYRTYFTSNHTEQATAAQMNTLNETDSEPCLLPPHPKAVELVLQLSGNRPWCPKGEAVVGKHLLLMLYTASSSHFSTQEPELVDMNIQRHVTEMLHLSEDPARLAKPLLSTAQDSGGTCGKTQTLGTERTVTGAGAGDQGKRSSCFNPLLTSEQLKARCPSSFSDTGRP